jgi:hypothetical protein
VPATSVRTGEGVGGSVALKRGFGSGSVAAGEHYHAEVNKKDLNVGAFTQTLNQRWRDGWRLAHVFEQGGNTVVVWERRDDAEPAGFPVPPPAPPPPPGSM